MSSVTLFASPARKVHEWVIPMEQLLASPPEIGTEVGKCAECQREIKVYRSTRLNFSYERLYVACPPHEGKLHSCWNWITPATHVPKLWPLCDCGVAMDYRQEGSLHVFR